MSKYCAKKYHFLTLLALLSLFSCGDTNPLKVDVSDVSVDLAVNRFEKELFEADKYKLDSLNKAWVDKYGILYESFIYQMLNAGEVTDPKIATQLEFFLNNKDMQNVYGKLKTTYADFTPYKNELTDAFKHYKHYFSDSTVPEITTFYSNFNAKVFPTPTNLAIGLDLYLGKDSDIIKQLPPEKFPTYLKNKIDPNFLVSETMKYWMYYKFTDKKEFANYGVYTIKEDFLSTIVHHGKLLYATEAMLPNELPELKFGYTAKDLDWCKANEKFIYDKLVEKNIIYTKNQKNIARFVHDGPFTSGFSDESPAMLGMFMGYQMVKQFMKKNPTVTLNDLLYKETNARKILRSYRI